MTSRVGDARQATLSVVVETSISIRAYLVRLVHQTITITGTHYVFTVDA